MITDGLGSGNKMVEEELSPLNPTIERRSIKALFFSERKKAIMVSLFFIFIFLFEAFKR